MDGYPLRWFVCIVLVIFFVFPVDAQPFDYSCANISTLWTNNPSIAHSKKFIDGSGVRPILLRSSLGPHFVCGYLCNGACNSLLFAIFMADMKNFSYIANVPKGSPQVVWSANPNNPVGENATLHLTQEGDLVLHNEDGSVAWSTNTSGKSVTDEYLRNRKFSSHW